MEANDLLTKEEEAQLRRTQRNFKIVAVVALATLVIGAVFYHRVEHLSWLNAFYFCTITLTTIGYGDIAPHTDLGKLFTIFYVLAGIGIIATFANLLLKSTMARRGLRRAEDAKKSPKKKS